MIKGGLTSKDTDTVNRAAYLLFAPRRASRFPQAEILVDAYADTKVSGKPRGQLNVNAPLLWAHDQLTPGPTRRCHPHWRNTPLSLAWLRQFDARSIHTARLLLQSLMETESRK